jgi:S1-C subfamily serine protease
MKILASTIYSVSYIALARICFALIALLATTQVFGQFEQFGATNQIVQPKMVKIFGAGGLKGLENYQSGFLISEDGLIVTVWSLVLDADPVTVILNNGKRLDANLLGYDPRTELALLKIDAAALAYFDINQSPNLDIGARVLAFSNLYGVATGNEPTSVLHGVVSAKANLDARRGAFRTSYSGPVYFVDAMTNNPGAAGGALTNHRGDLVGLIGKEYRDRHSNVWINYAIPISELTTSIEAIKNNEKIEQRTTTRAPAEPLNLELLGIVMIPNVLPKTPAFVDRLIENSPAAKHGLRPDDLIIEINGQMVASRDDVVTQLALIDREERVEITVRRDREIVTIQMNAR